MSESQDTLTEMALNFGCMYCGNKTDNFVFLEYYILPRKSVRKQHRDKVKQLLICNACFEANPFVISMDNKPFTISKIGLKNEKKLKCAICKNELQNGQLYGVIASLHMMGGSGIESNPLAFFCQNCVEEHTLDF